jgi:hypothetical protein
VSPRPNDPWRLPTLERFGGQLRDLEHAGATGSRAPRSPISPRAVLLSGGGIAAAVVAVLVVLTAGRTAQARSVLDGARAAAERAGTLRFQSVLTVTVNGRHRDGITEQGAIDFASGDYTTTVRFGNAGQVLERRSVSGVLYAAGRRLQPGAHPPRVHWVGARLQRGSHGTFASEGDAFTDPPFVFRALARIRAPVSRIGRENVNGVATTRYHLLTNLEVFLRPSAGHIENALAYRRVQAALDVWIDAQGRPVRVLETFSGPSASGRTAVTTVVRFSGYGRPVSVRAPASAAVTSTKLTTPPDPLTAGPGSLLARRLFFQPPAIP